MKKELKHLVSALVIGGLLGTPIVMHAMWTKKPSPAPAAKRAQARPTARPAAGARPAVNPANRRPASPMGNHLNSTSASRAFSRRGAGNLREVHRPDGSVVRMRSDGRVADVHIPGRGLDIHHGLDGSHVIRLDRPDHSGIFFDRGRPGYVQHPYLFHGHDFARRTYVYHGRVYSHFYHGYLYRGVYLHVYAPEHFYHPTFYGWAYRPWGHPVAYRWGFAGAPWYGYYGSYFVPSPVYPSASLWLTDYMLSATLESAYAARTQPADPADPGSAADAAAASNYGPPPAPDGASSLTPEVKEQIAEEVQQQIALENHEAQQNAAQQDIDPGSSGIDRMLNDGHSHVYIVPSPIDAEDSAHNGCLLGEGDVLQLRPPTPGGAETVNLVVISSKNGQECRVNTTVTVALDDLQEIQNYMRQNIDQGLQKLQASQGQDGIPALPETVPTTQTQAKYAELAPPPDPNAAQEIQQQVQQADQAEQAESAGGQQ